MVEIWQFEFSALETWSLRAVRRFKLPFLTLTSGVEMHERLGREDC